MQPGNNQQGAQARVTRGEAARNILNGVFRSESANVCCVFIKLQTSKDRDRIFAAFYLQPCNRHSIHKWGTELPSDLIPGMPAACGVGRLSSGPYQPDRVLSPCMLLLMLGGKWASGLLN